MEQLAADEFYQSEGLKYSAKDGCPYMIAVNRAASTVTVLALDDEVTTPSRICHGVLRRRGYPAGILCNAGQL